MTGKRCHLRSSSSPLKGIELASMSAANFSASLVIVSTLSSCSFAKLAFSEGSFPRWKSTRPRSECSTPFTSRK